MVGPVAFNSPLRAPSLTRLMDSRGSPEPGRLKTVQERIFCKSLFVKWLWWPPLDSFNRGNRDDSPEVTAKKSNPGFFPVSEHDTEATVQRHAVTEALMGRQIKLYKFKFGCGVILKVCLAYPEASGQQSHRRPQAMVPRGAAPAHRSAGDSSLTQGDKPSPEGRSMSSALY